MIRLFMTTIVFTVFFGITMVVGQDTADPFQPNSVWANEKNNKMILTIIERKGESFKALFENREINGKINGPSISWLAKDVRALGKNGVGGDNYGILKKDDLGFKIDFTWQNNAKGPKGFFTLRQVGSNNVASNPTNKNNPPSNTPNTKNVTPNPKEGKENIKSKTSTDNQTIGSEKDLLNKNAKDLLPDSQKLFLKKLIHIRQAGHANINNLNLNPIVKKEETDKIENQNQELKQNFKDLLLGGQIKNWQGKIIVSATELRILIGDLNDTFAYIEKEKIETVKESKPISSKIAPYIDILISIDSNLDKGVLDLLKKVSDYDLIDFSIKKFPPAFKDDLKILNWLDAKYNQTIKISFSSKFLDSLTPLAK